MGWEDPTQALARPTWYESTERRRSFRTTIAEGDSASSDLSVSSISPTASGATMKDANNNDVSTTITGGDLGTVTVDGDAPDFTSCAATDGTYKIGQTLTVTCTWDEAVVTSNGALTL